MTSFISSNPHTYRFSDTDNYIFLVDITHVAYFSDVSQKPKYFKDS